MLIQQVLNGHGILDGQDLFGGSLLFLNLAALDILETLRRLVLLVGIQVVLLDLGFLPVLLGLLLSGLDLFGRTAGDQTDLAQELVFFDFLRSEGRVGHDGQ